MQAVVDPARSSASSTPVMTPSFTACTSARTSTRSLTPSPVWANPTTGWGLTGDTFRAMQALERFDAVTWFRLGDADLATHLYRTGRMREGATLSEVTAEISRAWGAQSPPAPMSDDPVRTRLRARGSAGGGLPGVFRETATFGRGGFGALCGAEVARPAPGVLAALEAAEVVVVAPFEPGRVDRADSCGAWRHQRVDGAPRLGGGVSPIVRVQL